jgi:hypothetical protein
MASLQATPFSLYHRNQHLLQKCLYPDDSWLAGIRRAPQSWSSRSGNAAAEPFYTPHTGPRHWRHKVAPVVTRVSPIDHPITEDSALPLPV